MSTGADAAELIWPEPGGEPWVFAYGSLMWDPCFRYEEARPARLHGWHRSLCILSVVNRGSRERPGLALGLDRGGSCAGFAFRLAAAEVAAARERLWEREMLHAVYVPRIARLRLQGGERAQALVFVAKPGHPVYRRPAARGGGALVAQAAAPTARRWTTCATSSAISTISASMIGRCARCCGWPKRPLIWHQLI
ncbi:MAG: gamma-glutamylcyclotransferase [Rhodospirillales bacterium]